MRVIWLIFVLVVLPGSGFSQSDSVYADTLTDENIEHLFFRKTILEFRLSRDKTLLNSDANTNITSLRLGVRFKKHYKFGLLWFTSSDILVDTEMNPNVNQYRIHFNGFGGYLEYVVLKNYRFEFSIPLSFGRARAVAKAFDISGNRVTQFDTTSNYFGVISLGAYGMYSINSWLGVSMGLGYRWAFSEIETHKNYLDTPYYSLGLKVQIGKLHKTIFHHDQVLYMKSVYFRDRKPEKAEDLMRRSKKITAKKNRRNSGGN